MFNSLTTLQAVQGALRFKPETSLVGEIMPGEALHCLQDLNAPTREQITPPQS